MGRNDLNSGCIALKLIMEVIKMKLDALQDIGSEFNGVYLTRLKCHAVLYKSGFNRRPSLCSTIPNINGNGWGWVHDIKRVNCKECINRMMGF